MKRKSMRQEIIDSVAQALIECNKPEDALELRELCMHAGVSATEAFFAINHLINAGFRIRITDGLPHKFYYENNESLKKE